MIDCFILCEIVFVDVFGLFVFDFDLEVYCYLGN